MSIFKNARFEKQLKEIRAAVSQLDALEVSNNFKMARNYLLIWAEELIKICLIGDRFRFGDRFRYRLFLKVKFPTFEKNVKDFFIQVRSFRAEISQEE